MSGQRCEEIRDQLYAFLDDALDIQATLQVRAHLEVCSTCFQRYQFILNLRSLLREEAADFPLPPTLEHRIRKRVETGRVSFRRRVWLGVAAVLLLVLLPLGFFLRSSADLPSTLLAHHRAILNAQEPMRLLSSDPRQVMTWVQDQASLAIELPQASLAGFTLIGATVISLSEGKGVYVLYRRGEMELAYVVLPAQTQPLPPGNRLSIEGQILSVHREGEYTLGFWRVGTLLYALISRAKEQEFLEYAALCVRLST
ncbi:MAG: hypothetical protein D6736_05935 [Nitrospinota bacterium]|nr:MAG: hypothetical protein D6736_05935 [Nitrospinota bacterium]